MTTWRLIVHGAADGATNMALDDALLDGAAAGGPPTLRLYRWRPPCLSLGYFQPLVDVDRAACAAAGVELVRRPTGGRAVLHADEVTYAVAGSLGDPPFVGGVVASYGCLAQALLAALAELGVAAESAAPGPPVGPRGPACFDGAAAYEISAGERKLVGSAQTRRGGALLQPGAVPLGGDPARVVDLLALQPEARAALRARLAARSATLAALLGRRPDWVAVARAVAGGFAQTFGLRLVEGDLTAEERALAECARRERYASLAWLERR
ncbi:MAG: lipoate--protein ligase family protein [Chloroflexi bacterium]|nr:lipoate--protein ligase family protein [Chloroflexota bacterium]